MGTRADFYIGTGPGAKWLGSVAFDGYVWDEQREDFPLMKCSTAEEFVAAVRVIGDERNDWTSPEDGWPWPWNTSATTDYAYAFADGRVQVFQWGGDIEWPDMTDVQNVTLGARSGLIVLRSD